MQSVGLIIEISASFHCLQAYEIKAM